ncbi:MAG: hypothetical protein Q8Q82_13790 [Hydrogenophaga sp.]|nr:hypothetical protein [Hydrogenophaga sp.]
MGNIKHRLTKLEGLVSAAQDAFAGVLDIPSGMRPIDVLQNATPGLWLMICDRTQEGMLGRVTARGKREILYGGGA